MSAAVILDEIVQVKREELSRRKNAYSFASLRSEASHRDDHRSFSAALLEEGISLIAEIKRASPSAGLIREDFDAPAIGAAYERGGAAALSVLTDESYFRGSLAFLGTVRPATTLPLLRKDFIIDEYQVAEAGASGADAFLLIAAILSKSQVEEYIAFGAELGMDALVEVHDGDDLDKAVYAGSGIIGINNRDLKTFEVNMNTSIELGRVLPGGVIRVSESGIRTAEDVERLAGFGFDAVLVGESLMREDDPGEAARHLMGRVP